MHATRFSIGNMAHALTKELAVLLGFLGVALVGLIDMALGADINLLAVHLIPVLFAAWYASLRWGIFFAALMTAISAALIADAPPGTIIPWHRYLDLASDFVAILLLVYIQSRLRASYDHVRHLSRSDALTGCWNKSGFAEQLQLEIDRQKEYIWGQTRFYDVEPVPIYFLLALVAKANASNWVRRAQLLVQGHKCNSWPTATKQRRRRSSMCSPSSPLACTVLISLLPLRMPGVANRRRAP